MEFIGFIKFGEKEHIEDLVHNGSLFLNTVYAFRDIDNDYRGDKNEGVSNVIQSENAIVEFSFPQEFGGELGGKTIRIDKRNGLEGQILISNKSYRNTNIYSLYMVEASEQWKLDPRIDQFGDYGAFIYKPQVFLERVVNALDREGKQYSYGSVDYKDRASFEGELSLFNKFDSYRYQNEFRIIVENNADSPMKLSIGSIDDIAYALPTECFHNVIIKRVIDES